jgi:hypothetical protein
MAKLSRNSRNVVKHCAAFVGIDMTKVLQVAKNPSRLFIIDVEPVAKILAALLVVWSDFLAPVTVEYLPVTPPLVAPESFSRLRVLPDMTWHRGSYLPSHKFPVDGVVSENLSYCTLSHPFCLL